MCLCKKPGTLKPWFWSIPYTFFKDFKNERQKQVIVNVEPSTTAGTQGRAVGRGEDGISGIKGTFSQYIHLAHMQQHGHCRQRNTPQLPASS